MPYRTSVGTWRATSGETSANVGAPRLVRRRQMSGRGVPRLNVTIMYYVRYFLRRGTPRHSPGIGTSVNVGHAMSLHF
ncbi:MAG: hypothetical protein HDR84_08205 [Bacteroides sp.]|nr:hypothetical protein [Bacteroides sp.]